MDNWQSKKENTSCSIANFIAPLVRLEEVIEGILGFRGLNPIVIAVWSNNLLKRRKAVGYPEWSFKEFLPEKCGSCKTLSAPCYHVARVGPSKLPPSLSPAMKWIQDKLYHIPQFGSTMRKPHESCYDP